MTTEMLGDILDNKSGVSPAEKLSPQENIINIKGELTNTFFQILETTGLVLLLKFPELAPKYDMRFHINTSTQRTEIYRAFSIFGECLKNHNSELPNNLSYRSVNCKSIQEVDLIIQNSIVDGGKNPTDTRIGVCVSTTGKALEMAKTKLLQNGEPGVLFIYDSDKLQSLSKEEIAGDKSLNFVAGYGVKPKEGLNLSDALVCVIRLENPVSNQQS